MAKTVLITGASSGVGAATVEAFIEAGWNVVATMRQPAEPGDERRLVVALEVTDPRSIAMAVSAARERFGGIDAVVNNAGYGQYGIFEALTPEAVERQLAVNLLGPMNVLRELLPELRQRGGVVVNVSSGAGLYGLPGASAYCASKFALEGFTESIAHELSHLGVRVRLVVPHGGVAGTSFPGSDGVPASRPDLDEAYAPSQEAYLSTLLAAPQPEPIAAEAVAATILEAASDTGQQLRWLVGNDVRGFIEAWERQPRGQWEATMRRAMGSELPPS